MEVTIEASNVPEAINLCKKLWSNNYNSHQFDIKCRRVKPEEIIDYQHWFVRTDINNNEVNVKNDSKRSFGLNM